jgi:hypothetical protein
MMALTVLLLFQAQAFRAIPYYDPHGRAPNSYHDYAAARTDAPFQAHVLAAPAWAGIPPPAGRYNNLVLVFVNAGLYPEVESDIATYLSDVQSAGYATKLVAVTGGRPQNLRSTLQAHRDSGLVGTVMVGNLPVAWWSDSPSYGEDYPLDFFFTDLDGTWSDGDGDGCCDAHTGNVAPDIWLGRIDASRLTYGSEAVTVRSYLQRNHAFRTGQLAIPHRGLVLSNVFYTSDHGMSNMLSNVTNYGCTQSTSGYFYKQQLLQGYEFVHLVSHSSPWVNSFFDVSGNRGTGSVFNFEIPALGPHAVFYFLNACMCGRYTERDNIGNWYALASPFGQVVLASAQTMYGIDDLSDLYGYLGADSCVGGAFLRWHKDNYSWMSAMTILGDPTLKVLRDQEPGAATPAPRSPAPDPRSLTCDPLPWTVYPVDTTNFVSSRPRIGFAQGKIRLLYDSGRIVRSDNFFSSFNGTDFTRPESVAWHDYYDLFPCCCTDSSGRFWMVWQSFRDYDQGLEHFQLFSTFYNGTVWSGVNRVGAQAGYHDLQASVAAGLGDTVWCAFQSWRNGQSDIWVSSEANAGAWSTPVRLTSDSLEQLYPCVTTDHAGRPWVFWRSQINGRWCIQGRTNHAGWQPAFVIDSAGDDGPPRAAVDARGDIWVVWHSWQGEQSHIYYSRFADSAWTAPLPVTSGPANDFLPDICAGPDTMVCACWQSDSGPGTPSSIYWAVNDAGVWTPCRITYDNAHAYDATITTDTSRNVWIAWTSDLRGYWNIYAAQASIGPSPVGAQPGPRIAAFGVAPNPFARAVRFCGPAEFSVDVFSYDGRLVARQSTRSGRLDWAPDQLPRGVYLARVNASGRQLIAKLVFTK